MTDHLFARSPVWSQWAVRASAGAVMLLGALALFGWALSLAPVTRIVSIWPTMKPNTALLFVLAGGALLGLARATPHRWAVGAGGAVLVIALATVTEHVTGVDLGIDEWLFRDAATARDLHPGRMAGATGLALLLAGTALCLTGLGAGNATATRVARVLSGGIVAIGALSLLGHFLRVPAVYTWYPFDSVALPTAGALVLLGVGLLVAARTPVSALRPLSEDHRIIQAAALALALAAGATGIVGVATLESHVRRSTEAELQSVLNSQVAELTTNLDLRAARAAIVTTRPNLRRHLRILVSHPDNQDARQVVQGVLDSFLSHDFSRLVASLPGGEEVARTGDTAPATALLEVPLGSSGSARLLWRHGMALRHELALVDADGPLGTIVTEQYMPRVSEMLTSNSTRFATAEFLLCGPDGPVVRCFPSRLSAGPVVVPPGQRGSPPLTQRALAEAGVSTTVDYRGHRVFGAYTPLPGLGLAAALKVDVNELYAPARWQLGLALLVVFAVTAGGVALIRARVGPLATRLEQRVRERTTSLEQANARLSILHAIDRGLTTEQSPEDIAEITLRPLRDLLGVPRVIVILFDLQAGQAEWLAAVGRRRVRVGRGIRYSLELAGDLEALRRGEPQVIDVEALPPSPEAEALLKSGVRVYMVMPMIAGGALVGGLSFGGAAREFSRDQITIAEEMARQMAIVIERHRLTRSLLETNQTLRALVDASPLALWTIRPDSTVSMWNPTSERMFGWRADEVLGRTIPIVPEDRQHEFTATMARVLAGEIVTGVETRRQRKDGTLIDVSLAFAALRDAAGVIVGVTAIAAEITARLQLEAQLRQGQKLEAIGSLAGGIAHDFNNLLTVIGGRSHIIGWRLAPDDPLRREVEIIEKTAERAAALTHQLLAFSRKQALAPRVLDLNQVVTGMDRMLQRLIGEHIQLVTMPGANLGRVRVDPSQIEQVVLNLAVNARDAMPDGGRLTIAPDNVELDAAAAQRHPGVEPGAYVKLAVSDTGHGMDAATQAQLFVPFFTTKELGKGTGLGLATVYGIVKQSGGHIHVTSALDRGSTFEIYLPRVDEPADVVIAGAVSTAPTRGTETVLLTEDDAAVRALTRETLGASGYTVLEAGHPGEALHIAEAHGGPIHLLLTDVVMPGMSGRLLADQLLPLRPGIKVLFMSGYTAEAIGHHGMLAPGTAFLQKPFTPGALARRVREVLDTG